MREDRTVTITATISEGYAVAPGTVMHWELEFTSDIGDPVGREVAPGTVMHWELELPRVDPCIPDITLPILGDVGLPRWIMTGVALAVIAAVVGFLAQNYRRRFEPNPQESSENE